jgi:subtilase family serine protease
MQSLVQTDSTVLLARSLELGSAAAQAQDSAAPVYPGLTPQQIRTAYGINNIVFGAIVGDGTGQTIAIVDAYDDPDLVDSGSPGFGSSDLARFDQAFGLPDPPSFEKLNQYGSPTDLPAAVPAQAGSPLGDWAMEEALDVEWAHAIAPGARIVLIESNTNNGTDMYTGATTAAGLAGVSVVSMSWGASEFPGEQSFDSDFTTPSGHQGVTFVAATGDSGAPGEYPAYSPNVVAAGGTTLSLGPGGSYAGETAWYGGGGGVSAYETEPAYQQGVQNTGMRTIPDISFDADPSTGVTVYDSYNNPGADPWEVIGGTSLAAPALAALIAIANQGRVIAGAGTLDGASETLPALYAFAPTDNHAVTSGGNGTFTAGPGYNQATGLGTPSANLLVPDLAAYGIARGLRILTQPPATTTAGNPIGLSVLVEDSSGNRETTYNGPVIVTLAANPENAGASGTVRAIAQAGIATFSDLTLDRAGSGFTLVIDAGGTAFATTTAITVFPAAPTRLVLISEPTATMATGVPFGLTVAIEDNFGNVETSYNGTVLASLVGRRAKTALGGAHKIKLNQGMATFADLRLKTAGRGYVIELTTAQNVAAARTAHFRVLTAAQWLARTRAGSAHGALDHGPRAGNGHASKHA